MTYALLLLGLALAAPSAPPCGPVDPATTPIVEEMPADQSLGQRVYVIGFSKKGAFAWVELRCCSGGEPSMVLRVQDLVNDKELVRQEFPLPAGSGERQGSDLTDLCRSHGGQIAQTLASHALESTGSFAFEGLKQDREPTGVWFLPVFTVQPDVASSYEVVLLGIGREKRLGQMEQGSASGVEPELLGVVRSPWEPRVAVLVWQETQGSKPSGVAAITRKVTVFGGRLDKGWGHVQWRGGPGK